MIDLVKNEKRLLRRYLIWCYKTTKEELDKIDRYFTQNYVDQFISKQLTECSSEVDSDLRNEYTVLVDKFSEYAENKLKKAENNKYVDIEQKKCSAEYLYLTNRLKAVEEAIAHFLGSYELDHIMHLYETEMTNRILAAREHK